MAVRAGVRCLPVIVRCHPPTTAKVARWYEIAPERPHHVVEIEPPLDVGPIVSGLTPRYAKRALNRFLQHHYNQRLSTPRAMPAHVASDSAQYSPLV